MTNLGTLTETAEASLTNIIQDLEERISGIENTIEEIDSSVKGNVNPKNNPDMKHPGNLGHYEIKINLKRIGKEGGKDPGQRHRVFQQNHRQKMS